jgi:hypothetical protein
MKGYKIERERERKPKKRKKLSGEKCEGEEKMDKCSTGQKNPPLRKKRHKKEKNNGHVSEGE